MSPRLKSKNPNKTLFFRFQRLFRLHSSGRTLYTLSEIWPLIYPELYHLISDVPWAVCLYIGDTDLKSHGASMVSITIRFNINSVFYDTVIKLYSLDEIFNKEHILISSTDYNSILDWARAVSNNKILSRIASTALFKKAMHYT